MEERLETTQLLAPLAHLVERPDAPVEAGVDVAHVEQRVAADPTEQVARKVRHAVAREVPLVEDARRDAHRVVGVATRTEVLADVLAVAVTTHVTCTQKRVLQLRES